MKNYLSKKSHQFLMIVSSIMRNILLHLFLMNKMQSSRTLPNTQYHNHCGKQA